MKEKVKAEYLRRTRKILESKLNSGNLFKVINTGAVSLLRYSTAFIDWTKEEALEIDRTRKLLTTHKTHHPKDDAQWLRIKREEEGRGLISTEYVEDAIAGLHHYVHNSQERLISATWRSSEEQEVTEPLKITRKRRQTKRQQDWKNKRIHGQFIRDNEDIAYIKSWNWLRNGHLKRKTESLISAQDQCISINIIKRKTDGTRNDPKCRMCKANDETITHIISECPKLLQKEYKRQHDWMGKTVHWDICKKKAFNVPDKWNEHKPLRCTEK